MARFSVILPAAGSSSRMKGFQRKKPFVELKGRPVWVRTAEHFLGREDVVQLIMVVSADDMEWFRDTFRANLAFMNVQVVSGGATRAESVRNGLLEVKKDADFVAVHDAARPLLSAKWVDEIFAAAKTHSAVIPGLRITSTVKRTTTEGTIQETVDRSHLVMAQTPQVFRRELLEQAFSKAKKISDATDEASLVEAIGVPVHVIDGWPMNIKITTNEDFRLAELFVNAIPKPGGLKSLHPFADELFQ